MPSSRSVATLAGLAASLALCTDAKAGTEPIQWLNPVSGAWTDGLNWSGGEAPGLPGSLDDVLISAGPNAYTITLDSLSAVNSLRLLNPGATLLVTQGGQLSSTLGGELEGTLLLRGGTLTGGQWTGDTGTLLVEGFSNRIANASFSGIDLVVGGSVSSSLIIGGQLSLEKGSIQLRTTFSSLTFEDSQTIETEIVALGNTNSSRIAFANGSSNEIDTSGAIAAVIGTLTLSGSGGPKDVSLLNNGSIESSGAGRYVIENSIASFTNRGTISGAGDVSAATWLNEGTIQATAGELALRGRWTNNGEIETTGAILTLGGEWANNGRISVSDGFLLFGGAFKTDDLLSIERTDTVLRATDAIWDNSGRTLDLGALGSFDIRTSRIFGGAVVAPDIGGMTSFSLTFADAIINGDLRVGTNAGRINTVLENVTFVNGGLIVDGGGVTYRGHNTIDTSLTVVPTSNTLTVDGRLTIDAGAKVVANALSFDTPFGAFGEIHNHADIALGDGPSGVGYLGFTDRVDRFVNTGQITVARRIESRAAQFENLGTIEFGSDNTTLASRFEGLTNSGLITINGGHDATVHGDFNNSGGTISFGQNSQLRLLGTSTTSTLGSIVRTGGDFVLGATIDNSNDTLTLGDSAGLWSLDGATIQGGVVIRPGGPSFFDGETIDLIDVTLPGGDLRITDTNVGLGGSFALPDGDKIILAESNNEHTVLGVIGPLALDNITITGAEGTVGFDLEGALTLGPAAQVTGRDLTFSGHHKGELAGPQLTNHGLFQTEGLLRISTRGTLNSETGVIRALPGSTVELRGFFGTSLENRGVIEAVGGIIRIDTPLSNSGVVRATSGEIEFRGEYSIDSVTGVHASGSGRIVLGGDIDNVGRLISPDASLGRWEIRDGRVTGGTIDLDGSGLHVLGGTFRDVQFRGGDLEFENYTHFEGATDVQAGRHIALGSNATLQLEQNYTLRNDVTMEFGADLDFDAQSSIESGVVVRGGGDVILTGPFENRGTIRADGQLLRVFAGGSPDSYNDGVLESVNGGLLSIRAGNPTFVNRGIIRAVDSALVFDGVPENLGTIEVTNSNVRFVGAFAPQFLGDLHATDSTFRLETTWNNTGLTTNVRDLFDGAPLEFWSGSLEGGTFVLDDDRTLVLEGLSTVFRNVTLAGAGIHGIRSSVSILDNFTMTDGPLVFDSPQNRRLDLVEASLHGVEILSTAKFYRALRVSVNSDTDGPTLLASDSAIRGGGIFMTVTDNFENRGLIAAEPVEGGSGEFEIELHRDDAFDNQGIVAARDGGFLEVLNAHYLSNYTDGVLTGGRWVVENDSMLAMPGISITTNAGDIELRGEGSEFDAISLLARNDGRWALLDGRSFRLGAVAGTFVNAGDLEIGGDLSAQRVTLFESSNLTLILPDSAPGETTPMLEGRSTLRLDGHLDVILADGAQMKLGDTFLLLSGASILGEFDSISLPTLSAHLRWELAVSATAWTIVVVPTPGVSGLLPAMGAFSLRRQRRAAIAS